MPTFKPMQGAGVGEEGSRREEAERQAGRLERWLQQAERLAQLGTWEWETGSNRVLWSEGLHRLHGLKPGEFGGTYEAFLREVYPADRQKVEKEIGEVVRSPRDFVFEYRVVWPDGSVHRLSVRGEAVRKAGSVKLFGACQDVTSLRELERQRERTLSLLRSVLEATADGLLVVELDGRISSYNQRFAQMWNIPPEILAAHSDEQALKIASAQLTEPKRFLERVQALYASPEEESFETLELKDGRTFERLSRPQRLGQEVVGRVWSFRDVSEHRRALAARDEFLSIASHELRTPLATMVLMVSALRRDLARYCPGVGEVDRHLASLQRQVDRLSKLASEVVEVTRLHAGTLRLRFEEVDLAQLTRKVARRFQADFQARGYEVKLKADQPVVGTWDRTRLEQVLVQLFSNAVRYGAGRPIEVVVEQEGQLARLKVADQGIGISPERLPLIFGRFERAAPTRVYGGLGLGLYVAASLVSRLGGTIRGHSELGVGSTFVVELPLSPPPA